MKSLFSLQIQAYDSSLHLVLCLVFPISGMGTPGPPREYEGKTCSALETFRVALGTWRPPQTAGSSQEPLVRGTSGCRYDQGPFCAAQRVVVMVSTV